MPREIPVTVARLDPEAAGWLRALADTGPQRDTALARLRELVVRVARGEVTRRAPRLQMTTRNHELAVFRMTDRPIQDTFGLYREQATDATPSPADPQFLAKGRDLAAPVAAAPGYPRCDGLDK
jgi:hypothetical protein